MNSLKTRGFLRPYKPYSPPEDLEARFGRVCADVLGKESHAATDAPVNMDKVKLDTETRSKLLPALEEAIDGHRVPNSLVHTMATLKEVKSRRSLSRDVANMIVLSLQVFVFYSTEVETRTPYDALADAAEQEDGGGLPPNLQVQRDPIRFSLEGDGPFNVDAFPRVNSVMVTPEARRKYRDTIKSKSPWKNSISDRD